MHKLAILTVTAIVALSAACNAAAAAAAQPTDDTIRVVNMKGTGVGEVRTIPAIAGSGTTTVLCFDLPLLDPNTNRRIGTVTDCLSDITPVGDGLAVVGTQFFHIGGDTLVTRGLTSAKPKTHGSAPVTHITGAIPSPGDNDVLYGTGRFAGARGSVRLSGAINLSRLESAGEITWDCIFVIDLQ